MTTRAYVVKEMHLVIDAEDYQCEISGVNETETHTTATMTVACPDGSVTDTGPSTYTLDVSFTPSLLPDSFFRLLREHAGETATVTFEPYPVQEPGYQLSYDVTLIDTGGSWQVGSFNTATVQLPVTGKPTIVEPGP